MLEPVAESSIPILVVLTIVLATALPILTIRRTARAEDLRERILLSRPGRVEAWCVASIVAQAIAALGFGVLATVHPLLWGVVALTLSPMVATALYLRRFRRALRDLEAEVQQQADAADRRRASVSA